MSELRRSRLVVMEGRNSKLDLQMSHCAQLIPPQLHHHSFLATANTTQVEQVHLIIQQCHALTRIQNRFFSETKTFTFLQNNPHLCFEWY